MQSLTTEQLFKEINPIIDRFLGYAKLLQQGIHSEDKGKATDNPAVRAFTDADIIVQEGVARHLKKMVDQGHSLRFVPEEASPYNALFPENASRIVTFDPIDGTLVYKNSFPGFCAVFADYEKNNLKGALVHTPIDGKTYCAAQDEEQSWTWTPDESGNYIKNPWQVTPGNNNRIISMNVPEEITTRLREKGIELLQFGTPEMPPDLEVNAIYRGQIGGYFKQKASAFDWGPCSLIVEKGGGFVSDFQGNTQDIHHYTWQRAANGMEEGYTHSIIAVADKRMQETLVEVLSQWK